MFAAFIWWYLEFELITRQKSGFGGFARSVDLDFEMGGENSNSGLDYIIGSNLPQIARGARYIPSSPIWGHNGDGLRRTK